jgi:hypothetical protein
MSNEKDHSEQNEESAPLVDIVLLQVQSCDRDGLSL